MKKLIVGNWKMNGSTRALKDFVLALEQVDQSRAKVVLCPPFPFLATVRGLNPNAFLRGAQDCSTNGNGARTGDVSATFLSEFGCSYCIVGHSERRAYHGETDVDVQKKLYQLDMNDIVPILCVGETLEQRESGIWKTILKDQLAPVLERPGQPIVVAYEPVWAIGTGNVPTTQEIEEALHFIQQELAQFGYHNGKKRVLYGGSADEKNAKTLLSLQSLDGLLVGGASLDPARFSKIVESASDTNWAAMRA